MFAPLGFVRGLTAEQIAAIGRPEAARQANLPTLREAIKAGSWLCGPPELIIEKLPAIQEKYPGLEQVNVGQAVGTPQRVILEQLDGSPPRSCRSCRKRAHGSDGGFARPGLVDRRCGWVGSDPLYVAYHDEEWGVPGPRRPHTVRVPGPGRRAGRPELDHDPPSGATAIGAFDGFDPAVITRYGDDKVAALLEDTGIIRNRAKIRSAINNARASSTFSGSSAASTPTSGAS